MNISHGAMSGVMKGTNKACSVLRSIGAWRSWLASVVISSGAYSGRQRSSNNGSHQPDWRDADGSGAVVSAVYFNHNTLGFKDY